MSSAAWRRAYERSAREGITAPIAPALVVIDSDTATCTACGEQISASRDLIQSHGYRCPIDPWPLSQTRAAAI